MPAKSTILQIALPTPLRRLFDYLPMRNGPDLSMLKPGVRIKVPFQKGELVGVLIKCNTDSVIPKSRLKKIIEILDETPVLDQKMLKLCAWGAEYYQYSLGEVLTHALPAILRQGKKVSEVIDIPQINSTNNLIKTREGIFLNSSQQEAVTTILNNQGFKVFLINGVTGSGKTEVYLQVIERFLNDRKQILILVPEIGLTPQTIERFRCRFSVPIVSLHSGLSEKERLNAWNLSRLGEASIVIGTRSAIFSPFKNLGLIIIDEEHDLSFKQQDGFRYHARDIAIMRAKFLDIPIVLGSATPAIESLFNSEHRKFTQLSLPQRAGVAELPTFEIIDIRHQTLEHGLSQTLLKEMQHHIAQNNQVMLFLNRRGYAPIILCHDCGWMIHCERCDTRMTYHQSSNILRCHHCDKQKSIPLSCEHCQGKQLIPVGLGTEKLELVLQKYFPNISIVRIDRDSTRRKGSMEKLLSRIQKGEDKILIGTQMLAKGHHFPNVTLVAIVDADGGFFSADFRALERMGQLILQVAGRAGRNEKKGKVLIQTHYPDHPLIHQLFRESYAEFAKTILQERKLTGLPPFSYFVLFRAEAHSLQNAQDFLMQIKNLVEAARAKHFTRILGPIPAAMAKRAGRFRMQLLIQANHRPLLQNLLKNLVPQIEKIPTKNKVRWSLDVDPIEMG